VTSNLQKLITRLAGRPGAPRSVLELRVRFLLGSTVIIANVSGALVVLLFVMIVIPDPRGIHDPQQVHMINLIEFFSYPLVAAPAMFVWGFRMFAPLRRLIRDGGPPDREQRRAVLLGPLRLTILEAVLWGPAAVAWAALNLQYSPLLALKIGLTCVLGAITTCAIVYLLAERLLRPAAAMVLVSRPARLSSHFSVTTRAMLAWALGTAIPVVGMLAAAVASVAEPGWSQYRLALCIIGLCVTALVVGFQVTYVAARAINDPIRAVRMAMARVAKGDLDTEVEVYDATEVGLLQAGFNTMVAGLREHERLRDLFGRHVGEDVADLAFRHDIELGGEVREVAVLFVDLAGSTQMASTRPPAEVVSLLNAFFGIVVDVVSRNDGWINKFEGDAALAIFGAPVELPDAGGRALSAARDLAARLAAEVPEVKAGVGVSAGPVVAGYIGAEQRFEYTVIGDPVNEAARLSDLAKGHPDGVLASSVVLETAAPQEALRWQLGRSVTLRGRTTPTMLASPHHRALPAPEPLPHRPVRTEAATRRPRLRLISLILQAGEHLTRARD
jgi:adenylate cyclase